MNYKNILRTDWYGIIGIGAMWSLGRAAMDLGYQYFNGDSNGKETKTPQ